MGVPHTQIPCTVFERRVVQAAATEVATGIGSDQIQCTQQKLKQVVIPIVLRIVDSETGCVFSLVSVFFLST